MKRFIISLLLHAILPAFCLAQTDPCAGKKFLYQFVNPNESPCINHYYCSDDPKNYTPAYDWYVHWASGTTIKYSTGDLSQPCVDATAINKCIDNAFCTWTGLCADGPLAQRVAANPTDLSIFQINNNSDPTAFGMTLDKQQQIVANTSITPLCNGAILVQYGGVRQSWVDINTSTARNNYAQDVYPCPSSNKSCAGKGIATDLCLALTHEIGHVLGLKHTFGNQPQNPIPEVSPNDCGTYSIDDIMYWDVGASTANNCTGSRPKWTINDCCNYKDLYCKGSTAPCPTGDASCGGWDDRVTEGSLIPSFDPKLEAYPNPTTGMLNIQFSSDKVGTVLLAVYDMLGHQLFTKGYRVQQERETQKIDISFLPIGHYIVRIVGANLRGSRLIELVGK